MVEAVNAIKTALTRIIKTGLKGPVFFWVKNVQNPGSQFGWYKVFLYICIGENIYERA